MWIRYIFSQAFQSNVVMWRMHMHFHQVLSKYTFHNSVHGIISMMRSDVFAHRTNQTGWKMKLFRLLPFWHKRTVQVLQFRLLWNFDSTQNLLRILSDRKWNSCKDIITFRFTVLRSNCFVVIIEKTLYTVLVNGMKNGSFHWSDQMLFKLSCFNPFSKCPTFEQVIEIRNYA